MNDGERYGGQAGGGSAANQVSEPWWRGKGYLHGVQIGVIPWSIWKAAMLLKIKCFAAINCDTNCDTGGHFNHHIRRVG